MADHPSSDAAGGQSDGPGGGLAARLAALPVGPELLTALVAVELSGLDAYDTVAVITGWERLARWASAAQLAAMAELPERDEYQACRSPQDSEALHSHDPVDPAGDELSLALQLSPGRAKATLVQAQELTSVLPDTLAALSEGKIDVRRAGKIADHTRILDVEARRRVEAVVLPKAHRQTVTQLERALQRAVIVADPAAAERRRETASRGRRVERPRPSSDGGSDGQAYLSLVGPAEDVIALYTAVNAAARHQRVLEKAPVPGVPDGLVERRTLDQLRFDILTTVGWTALQNRHLGCCNPTCTHPDAAASSPAAPETKAQEPPGNVPARNGPSLEGIPVVRVSWARLVVDQARAQITGTPDTFDWFNQTTTTDSAASNEPDDLDAGGEVGSPMCFPLGTRRGRAVSVNMTIPITALIGADDQPGELDGFGPVTATAIRDTAWRGLLHRVVTDPIGEPLAYGRTTYRPPPELAEHIATRDVTCRFPTCNHDARTSDIDHQHPWDQGGPTDPDNLWALHRSHHLGKTHHNFRTITGRADGTVRWVTPAGHTYPVEPELARMLPSTAAENTTAADHDPPPF